MNHTSSLHNGAYHIECANLPPGDFTMVSKWHCPVCVKNKNPLVTNLKPVISADFNTFGFLGHDRNGRKYYFAARRIWIESQDRTVTYYTTKKKFRSLRKVLEEDFESELLNSLKINKNAIKDQMETTEDNDYRNRRLNKYKNIYTDPNNAKYAKLAYGVEEENALLSAYTKYPNGKNKPIVFRDQPGLEERLC